jgi:hypothetical protein
MKFYWINDYFDPLLALGITPTIKLSHKILSINF